MTDHRLGNVTDYTAGWLLLLLSDNRVDIQDTITTGVSPGPPPWGADGCLARGEMHGYNCGRI